MPTLIQNILQQAGWDIFKRHHRILDAYALCAAMISAVYVMVFGYTWPSILLHVLLVGSCCWFVLVLAEVIFCSLPNQRFSKGLIFALFLLFHLVLATTYSANFISSFFWSAPMYDSALTGSLGMLIEYYFLFFSKITEIPLLLRNETWGILFASLMAGIPLIAAELVVCVYFAKKISHILSKTIKHRRRTGNSLLTLMIALAIVYTSTQIAKNSYTAMNWRGEVIIDTLLLKGSHAYPDAYRDKQAQQDRTAFANFNTGNGNQQNIVIIMLDAFRGDFVYDKKNPPPFISELLEKKSLQKIDAFSVCPNTTCGILALLSSKDITRIHNHSVMVQEVFKQAGYATYIINAGLPEWYGLEYLYKETFDHYFDTHTTSQPAMSDDIFIHVMPQLELTPQQPFFMFLRMMSTHEYGRLNSNDWVSRYEYATRVYQADEYIKQIFSILEQKGVLDKTTVIITGDHGQSLGEKNERGHNISLYHNQIHVPILVYDPDSVLYPARTLASSLDVVPTVLERAGLAIPPFMEGQSLLHPGSEERWLFHAKVDVRFEDKIRAVTHVQGNKIYKYIHTGARRYSTQQHKEEVFELSSDPEENHNLMDTLDPQTLADLKKQYRKHFRD